MEGGLRKMVVDAIFPRFCVSCNKEGSLWCNACDAAWIQPVMIAVCPFCTMTGSNRVCRPCSTKNYLNGLSACSPYGNPVVRKALSCWKYDGDRSIEPVIKKWLMQSRDLLHTPHSDFFVTHIPIHPTRRRSRGFDQAEMISSWIGEMYGMPSKSLLIRTKKTRSQAMTRHTDRHVGQLDGIFKIDPMITKLPKMIVLCDDVFTSGATMDAAAKCLKEVGAQEVWGLVVGKG